MPSSDQAPQNAPTAKDQNIKMPVGIILILILTGISIIGMLANLINPMILLGDKLITGPPALLYNLAFFTIDILLFIWLLKRYNNGRILGIIKAGYSIFFSVMSYVFFYFNSEKMMENFNHIMPGYIDLVSPKFIGVVMIFSIMMNLLIGGAVIVYLILKKDYFKV